MAAERKSHRQIAFLFDEAGNFTVEKIGGKAMSLVTMTRMGMPVPPGFAIPTGVCRAYLEHARFPRRLEWHVRRCLEGLEKQTGKWFGDPSNPLLVSVRSGAPKSMPGMMDTILNLGITEETTAKLAKRFGAPFAADVSVRFQSGFRKVTGSEPLKDPWEQLWLAFEAICMSWLNDRAVEYRRAHQIPENLGTAMIVQQMALGNLDDKSGTGVLFSRNVATGEPELYGEFLPQAQGDDVVSGAVTPSPISKLAELHPQVFNELAEFARVLERRENDVIEIEYTVESGRLWMLQYRVAKRTPVAAARFAVQAVWEKRLPKAEAVARVSGAEVVCLRRPEFDPKALETAPILGRGIPASSGSATGVAVFTSALAQEFAKRLGNVVLVRQETNLDDFAGMLASVAIVTMAGGATSHAAVVARGLGKPAVVGSKDLKLADIAEGTMLSVDGTRGLVLLGSVPFTYGSGCHEEISIFLKWRRGGQGRVVPADFSSVGKRLSANTSLNDFYLVDIMTLQSAGTDLEKEANVLCRRVHERVASEFAAYLLISLAGELRHCWDSDIEGKLPASLLAKILYRFGDTGLGNRDRLLSQESIVPRLKDAGADKQGKFARLAYQAFSHPGAWTNNLEKFDGSVGGKRWADISETVADYLGGMLSTSLFVDRIFDLRHNGGRLFNKHLMFGQTDEDLLRQQLDRKRSHSVQSVDKLVRALAFDSNSWRRSLNPLLLFEGDRVSPEVKQLWEKGKGRLWWRGNE